MGMAWNDLENGLQMVWNGVWLGMVLDRFWMVWTGLEWFGVVSEWFGMVWNGLEMF